MWTPLILPRCSASSWAAKRSAAVELSPTLTAAIRAAPAAALAKQGAAGGGGGGATAKQQLGWQLAGPCSTVRRPPEFFHWLLRAAGSHLAAPHATGPPVTGAFSVLHSFSPPAADLGTSSNMVVPALAATARHSEQPPLSAAHGARTTAGCPAALQLAAVRQRPEALSLIWPLEPGVGRSAHCWDGLVGEQAAKARAESSGTVGVTAALSRTNTSRRLRGILPPAAAWVMWGWGRRQ